MSEFANQSIEKVTNFGIIKDMLNEQDERSPLTIEQIENPIWNIQTNSFRDFES